MKLVYYDSSIPEKEAKSRYNIPENLMMENAASALESAVHSINKSNPITKVLIICGNGNNGGDGLALARRLQGLFQTDVVLLGEPKTQEAKTQYQMCKAMEVSFISAESIEWKTYGLIVDCLYGTGFHGSFDESASILMEKCNQTKAVKLACDIPSGIAKDGTSCKNAFEADFTVTMGAYKLSLLSDQAKNLCGEISVADLGISSTSFQSCYEPNAYLIEESDIKLPFRKDKSAHKGHFGHTVVYAGEKAGAAVLSAGSALQFGSGLSTLLKTENSNLSQFKISPSLMVASKLPAKTTSVVIGNGLGTAKDSLISEFTNWFTSTKNPACVIDADLFNYSKLNDLLETLNQTPDSRIVLTPHPKEFQTLVNHLKINGKDDYSIPEVLQNRINLGTEICNKFPQIILVLKSANTFILQKGQGQSKVQVYICNNGSPSLAKAGSGDVLAGMIGGLLAQGYSAIDAAITACYAHGKAGANFKKNNYSLTPEKLIEELGNL